MVASQFLFSDYLFDPLVFLSVDCPVVSALPELHGNRKDRSRRKSEREPAGPYRRKSEP